MILQQLMAVRMITEFFKPGPPQQPLSAKLATSSPSKKPVGRRRKRSLDHDDEVPLFLPTAFMSWMFPKFLAAVKLSPTTGDHDLLYT